MIEFLSWTALYVGWLVINYRIIRWLATVWMGEPSWTRGDRRMCIFCALIAPITYIVIFMVGRNSDSEPADW